MNFSQSPFRNLLTSDSHDSLHLKHDQFNLSTDEHPASPTTPTINIDVDYLNGEQKKIDSTINFLLNYNPKKKKPGRPPKSDSTNSSQKVHFPDSVPDQFKSISNINDLHPGVLLDYLTKVNNFNKEILHSLNSINEKYNDLNRKIDLYFNNKLKESSLLPSNNVLSQPNVPGVFAEVKRPYTTNENLNEDLELRLDILEQRNNANTLSISGESLWSLIQDKDFKSKIIETIIQKTDNIVNKDEIDDIIVIGKEKKNFKVICRSLDVKNKILSFARQRKPKDIFVSEFLTSFRNRLFYQARQLKKIYPNCLSSVYTRSGNVFYKLKNNQHFFKIKKLNDIEELKSKLLNLSDNSKNDL